MVAFGGFSSADLLPQIERRFSFFCVSCPIKHHGRLHLLWLSKGKLSSCVKVLVVGGMILGTAALCPVAIALFIEDKLALLPQFAPKRGFVSTRIPPPHKKLLDNSRTDKAILNVNGAPLGQDIGLNSCWGVSRVSPVVCPNQGTGHRHCVCCALVLQQSSLFCSGIEPLQLVKIHVR